MDPYEQHAVTRLCSLLHLVFSSRFIPSELYSWCQTAFPGCCYLSCATLTADNSFATTSNLVARGSLQVGLQSVQQGQAMHGAVLHNSWPLQYPDLQQLRESSHWDTVIVTGVPEIPVVAASPASASPQANGLAHSPTSSQESLVDAQADSHTPTSEVGQARVSDCEAQSMLILGLRGQNHDLERALDNLRFLSHQLTPVMHCFRQQLIDQAWHAANTAATAADRAATAADTAAATAATPADTAADTAATAADSGNAASMHNSNADPATGYVVSTTAQQQPPANIPDSAFDPPLGAPAPHMGYSSPFAMSEAAVGPFLPLGGVTTRQGRRQEISGSLSLEQMLSRLPSPVGSATALDRGSSDGAASNRHASRLGSSFDLSQLVFSAPTQPPTLPPDPAADPTPAPRQTQDRWSLDSLTQRHASHLGSTEIPREGSAPEQSQVPATNPQGASPPQLSRRTQATAAAAVGANLDSNGEAAHPLTTVYSGQRLLLASAPTGPLAHESTALPDATSPSVSHEGELPRLLHGIRSTATNPNSSRPTPQRGDGQAVHQNHGAVGLGGKVAAQSLGSAEDNVLVSQLQAEAEARIREQQRQHPWLMYFYDGETERDYRKYHATHMAMVDAFSWGIGLVIYLILGFSGGHAYASRVPVTFAVVLGFHVACLYATVFMQDRVSPVRDQVVRAIGFAYLAVQSFRATPLVLQSASIAQMHRLSFLARYSNTSTLVTTSLGFMVRLHIHLPCQLVNFAMSAAVLPKAICRAGFPEHSSWKCLAVGVSTQFLIGVVLSTAVVALNERRLRAMYIRSSAAQRAAATKVKAA